MQTSSPRVTRCVLSSGLCASPKVATHSLTAGFKPSGPLPSFHQELTLNVSMGSAGFLTADGGTGDSGTADGVTMDGLTGDGEAAVPPESASPAGLPEVDGLTALLDSPAFVDLLAAGAT